MVSPKNSNKEKDKEKKSTGSKVQHLICLLLGELELCRPTNPEVGEKPSSFVAIISKLTTKQLRNQFDQLIGSRKIDASGFLANKKLNRYAIPMHEKKRVKLGVRTDDDRDYIDATYASFNREDYIIVQSPSKANVGDFWRMVWQDGVMLIVCVVEADNFSETDVTKCYPYWPVKQHSTMKILGGRFILKLNKKKEEKGFNVYDVILEATNKADVVAKGATELEGMEGEKPDKKDESNEPRHVIIMHFLDWTPSKWPNIDRLGAFVHSMSTKETTIIRRITDDYVPPVVIQGHQGINRSCAVWVGTVLMKQIERKECFDVEYLVRYLTRLRIGAFQDRINFFLTFAIAYRIASLGGWISLAEAKGRIKEIRAAALGSSVKESPNSKSKQDSGRKKRAKSLVSS